MTDITFCEPASRAPNDLSFSFMAPAPTAATTHQQLPDISFQEPTHVFENVEEQTQDGEEMVCTKTMPKSTLEIEIERIQAEKRALLRYKKKQQRLYERIRQEHQERMRQQKLMGGPFK